VLDVWGTTEGQLHNFLLSPTEGNVWSASTRCRFDRRLIGLHSSYGRCCEEEKLAPKYLVLTREWNPDSTVAHHLP